MQLCSHKYNRIYFALWCCHSLINIRQRLFKALKKLYDCHHCIVAKYNIDVSEIVLGIYDVTQLHVSFTLKFEYTRYGCSQLNKWGNWPRFLRFGENVFVRFKAFSFFWILIWTCIIQYVVFLFQLKQTLRVY